MLQAMVEGGAGLFAGFLAAGLVDRLQLYFGATVVGAGAPGWAAGAPLAATSTTFFLG